MRMRIQKVFVLAVGLFLVCCKEFTNGLENVGHAPPVPGMSETSEDLSQNNKNPNEKDDPNVPKLLGSYIPPTMQVLHYLSEVMGYEIIDMTTLEPPLIENEGVDLSSTTPRTTTSTRATTTTTTTTRRPFTTTTTRPSTTSRTTTTSPTTTTRKTTTTTTTTTTPRPTTTRRTTSKPDTTTPSHKPGYYGPAQPPSQDSNYIDEVVTSTTPNTNVLNHFYSWFFQTSKAKQLKPDLKYNLQLLDGYPAALLHDIEYEGYEQPTLLDDDNVNEFLRVYDDFSYIPKQSRPFTGAKKKPVTKTYLDCIMLYDLLKREAKKLGFNKYEGYTTEMLYELADLSNRSVERQLYYLLKKMLDKDKIDKPDIISRSNSIIRDLENPNSITSKTLRFIPPLKFLP